MTTKKQTYIKVDPNDDSGNDDGILDRMELTAEEAAKRNEEIRNMKMDYRWIKLIRNARPDFTDDFGCENEFSNY